MTLTVRNFVGDSVRLLSMMLPSPSCTAWHSVLLIDALALTVHVLPWSVLISRLEKWPSFSSRPWVGITSVPSESAMPDWGEGA